MDVSVGVLRRGGTSGNADSDAERNQQNAYAKWDAEFLQHAHINGPSCREKHEQNIGTLERQAF